MEQKKLDEIVRLHKMWVYGYSNGVRANLSGANLSDAYLGDASLSGANLRGANLSDAILSGANLSGANLSDAYLSGAYLGDAILSGANLSGANLSDADLSGAYLGDANLSGANLSDANLSGANLRDANLSGTSKSTGLHCPEEGSFTAWKKCDDNVIVKLQVPAKAKRSSATTNKCRAEFIKVLEVFGEEKAISCYDKKTEYVKGRTVRCHKWDDNRWNECSGGIHFFLTRIEAEEY